MTERFEIVKTTLVRMLEDKKYKTLREVLTTMNPSDIAAIFDELEASQCLRLFRLLPKELAAETFAEMEPEAQEQMIRGFSDEDLKVLDI